jgi:hypothetical protein
MDYYLLFVWEDVEPELIGPFDTIEERDSEAQKYRREHGEQHGYYPLEVITGCKVEVGCFSGSFFGE